MKSIKNFGHFRISLWNLLHDIDSALECIPGNTKDPNVKNMAHAGARSAAYTPNGVTIIEKQDGSVIVERQSLNNPEKVLHTEHFSNIQSCWDGKRSFIAFIIQDF